MKPRRTMLLLWCLGLTLAACGGGSGSTGLITSEDTVIDDVRQTGTCGEFDGAPYCATDSPNATAPGGQTASVVTPGGATPVRTPSPVPTFAGSPTPAPSASAGGATATPPSVPTATAGAPSATPTPGAAAVTIAVRGFRNGSVCATGARTLGTDEAWRTGTLVAVDPAGAAVTYPLPDGVAPPLELALLCFDPPPAALPSELTTLADANPTVVFVLPSP